MVVGHISPEAQVGGPIAFVQEGDSITIDADKLLIQLNVDDAEIARRKAAWRPPPAERLSRSHERAAARAVSGLRHGEQAWLGVQGGLRISATSRPVSAVPPARGAASSTPRPPCP
jgi:dihydroxyacid dehydratase/phosphogluconate dehydratase